MRQNAPLATSLMTLAGEQLNDNNFNNLQTIRVEVPFSDKEKVELELLQLQKEKFLVLEWFLQTAIAKNELDSAIEVLREEEDNYLTSQYLTGLYLQMGELEKAAEVIAALPTATEEQAAFKFIQSINVKHLSNPEDFQLGESDQAELTKIAEGSLPSAAYARGLLALLKGMLFYPPSIENDLGAAVDNRSATTELTVIKDFLVFPNPTKGDLNISVPQRWNDKNLQIEIYDTFGSLKMQKNVRTSKVNINSQALNNGIFFLRIKHKNEVIYQYKIAIQH